MLNKNKNKINNNNNNNESKERGIMLRLDKSGRLTECKVKDEDKVGKGSCCHIPGEQFILHKGEDEEQFYERNKEYINNLEYENAKENDKIKEEVPKEIYRAIINSHENPQLIVAGTGIGKSSIIHSILYDQMRDKNKNLINESIIVVPNNDLKKQFEKYGMIKENGYNIVSYQKLNEWKDALDENKEYNLGFDISICKSVSFDECHKVLAPEWSKACENLIISLSADCKIYGFTATPTRTDGRDASEFFGDPIYEISVEEAFERDCYNNPPDYITSTSDTVMNEKLKKLRKILDNSKYIVPIELRNKLKDFEASAPDIEKEQSEIILSAADKLMCDNNRGIKAIVFCSSVADVKESKEAYEKLLIDKYGAENVETLEYISGKDKFSSKQQDIWDRFSNDSKHPEKGKIQIVYSIQKFDEGFHIDDIDMAIRRKPTESGIVSKQEDGRMLGRRKTKGVILDFAGSIRKEGSLDWERIANHVRKSEHYGYREILHDRGKERYIAFKELEKEIMSYSSSALIEHNGEYLTPATFAKKFNLNSEDKNMNKYRLKIIRIYIENGFTVDEILKKRYAIENYYGGFVDGVDNISY